MAARGGVNAQRAIERIDARLETLDEFSMKGLGMDLVHLAVRAASKAAADSRKDADSQEADESPKSDVPQAPKP